MLIVKNNTIMPNVVMLNVVMLNMVMLNVVAPSLSPWLASRPRQALLSVNRVNTAK